MRRNRPDQVASGLVAAHSRTVCQGGKQLTRRAIVVQFVGDCNVVEPCPPRGDPPQFAQGTYRDHVPTITSPDGITFGRCEQPDPTVIKSEERHVDPWRHPWWCWISRIDTDVDVRRATREYQRILRRWFECEQHAASL
jgi:hypothetical protein